jgi:oligogalacturonide lyase
MTKLFLLPTLFALGLFAAEPPKSWVDPDTGHRVVRLTNEPGSASLYFNQNGYTADGKEMVYTTPEGIGVLNLATGETRNVVKDRVRIIVTGHKTQSVYYIKAGEVYATNVDTLETRKLGKLPPRGSVATVNADETLVAGTYIEGDGLTTTNAPPAGTDAAAPAAAVEPAAEQGQMMEQRLAARPRWRYSP